LSQHVGVYPDSLSEESARGIGGIAGGLNHQAQTMKTLDCVCNTGSREAAMVHASLAASIMYSVSRACREGQIQACGCSRRRSVDKQVRWTHNVADTADRHWQWGGCSDNTEYGYGFTTSFVDSREREKNYPRHSTALKHMLMNLHNNEAGRLVRVSITRNLLIIILTLIAILILYKQSVMRLRFVCLSVHRFQAKTGRGMKIEKLPWDVGRGQGSRGG